jgi:hypothetical protein
MVENLPMFLGRPFDSSETPHGAYVHVGSGLEHVVWSDPYSDLLEREGVEGAASVHKLNLRTLRACNSGTPAENIAAAIGLARQRTEQHGWVQTTFGSDFVPFEHTAAYAMELTAEDISKVWPDEDPARRPGTFYLTITTQDRVRELEDRERLRELYIPYAELSGATIDPGAHRSVHERWISNAADLTPPTGKEVEEFLQVQSNPEVAWLLREAADSRQQRMRHALGRVVGGLAVYGNTYGQTIDFMGSDNIIVTTGGGAKLIDPLVPASLFAVRDLPTAFNTVRTGALPLQRVRGVLLNGLSFVRSVNFLAAYLELTDRVQIYGADDCSGADWTAIYHILTGPAPNPAAAAVK